MLELSHATALTELEEKARTGQLAEATIEWFGAERLNLQVRVAPLVKQGGAVMVLNDITRLMKLETIRKDFVANVSHELKTPIQSIKGFVETLENAAGDDPVSTRRFLAIIRRNSERLEAIVDDLLSLARIEGLAEKGGMATAQVDIRGLIERVRETLHDPMERRQITLLVEGSGSPIVAGSAGLLEQLLLNLVDNAIKYCPPGSTVRLKSAYYVTCTGFTKDAAGRVTEIRCTYEPESLGGGTKDGRKVKGTIHWVSTAHALDALVRQYDVMFSLDDLSKIPEDKSYQDFLNPASLTVLHGKAEAALAEARVGDYYQFLRQGYYTPDNQEFISVGAATVAALTHSSSWSAGASGAIRPALVFNRTCTLKDTWGKMSAKDD